MYTKFDFVWQLSPLSVDKLASVHRLGGKPVIRCSTQYNIEGSIQRGT